MVFQIFPLKILSCHALIHEREKMNRVDFGLLPNLGATFSARPGMMLLPFMVAISACALSFMNFVDHSMSGVRDITFSPHRVDFHGLDMILTTDQIEVSALPFCVQVFLFREGREVHPFHTGIYSVYSDDAIYLVRQDPMQDLKFETEDAMLDWINELEFGIECVSFTLGSNVAASTLCRDCIMSHFMSTSVLRFTGALTITIIIVVLVVYLVKIL